MKPINIQVIPAQNGYFEIHEFDGPDDLEKGEPVIAWRIETFERGDDVFSVVTPLTVDGETSNCIGVLNPDLTVTVFQETTYSSLDELKSSRKPKHSDE